MGRRYASAVLVALAVAGCGDPDSLPAFGTLERDRLELAADASEPVVELAVREGELVEAGALVARLDPTRRAAELERREAELERARAALAELEQGGRSERRREAAAEIEAARAALAYSERVLERAGNLHREGIAAASDVDLASTAREEAEGRLSRARAALDELVSGATLEQLGQGRAAVAAAEAAVAAARTDLARLELRAPVAARVDVHLLELGERATVGGVVSVLLAAGRPWARVHVPAASHAAAAPGQPARVVVDGTERSYAGCVRRLAGEASFTPFYALSEHDRGRLAWLAEVDLVEPEAEQLPSGVPVQVFVGEGEASRCR